MTERVLLVNWVVFRLVLPFILLAACIFRFNLFTLIYGVFFLLVPLARSPNVYTIRRHTGALIWALTVISGLFMLTQIGFQIALGVREPYGHEFPNCSVNENITRQVGLYRLDHAKFNHVARLVLPDVAVFLVSVVLAVLAFKTRAENADAPSNADEPLRPHRESRTGLLRLLTELIILVFVAAAGIISPSLISSFYFLCFLFIGTFWACLGNSEKLFVQYIRYVLLGFCAAHLAVLFVYQVDYMQELLDKDSFPARLVGMLAIIRLDCDEPRDLHFHQTPWFNFVCPAILISLYYLLATHVRQWKGYTVGRRSEMRYRQMSNESSFNVSTQQIRNPFTQYRLLNPNGQRPVTFNAARETVTIQPPSPLSESSMHHYRIRMILQYLGRLFVKQSYIISLISMMGWSVLYHSWLTFVFLLLAIFLWLIPPSRTYCLRLSPVYTLYAEILLTAQFIFSLNIKEEIDTLPDRTYVDLSQIGFQRSSSPVFYLAVQSLFTFFFWTTLRLFMKERQMLLNQDENGVNLDDVNGSVLSEQYFLDPGTHSWLWRIGRSIEILMIKFWIVLCGAMLLVISMQGKVVIYRIVYMALLLCFVVMLQVSYKLWRKMLYVFWITVIFYSMVVLLLIYTYQFKYFPGYWQNFTSFSPEMLADFGLETYQSKGDLIVGLLTPTAFLILCILQLHYLHPHFLNITSNHDGQYKLPSFELQNQTTDLAKPSGFAIRCLQFIYKWSHLLLDFGWRLLEIHILKVCLFTILLAAVVDPSAINLIFVLLVAISLMAYNGVSVVAQSSSTIAAVLVIVKMVYQLRMVKEEPFTSNCSYVNSSNFNRSDNDWVGFRKVPDIAFELRVYISVILIVTLRAIIVTRHRFFADALPANQLPKPGIAFMGVTLKDADVGMVSCMQYLWNYGFHRFGLEICFVTMVINMCSRLDVFAVVYGIILLVMFVLSRRTLAKIWGVYVVILGLLLPIQYLLVLGIPRGLCITYPWDRMEATRIFTAELIQWLYLPDAFFPPKASILIGDFFQLLFACCQWRVFNIETVYANEPYEGGSNENIIRSGKYRRIFENPVPDFMTFTTSYLDVLKVFVFNYMYWATLAVAYIAGTSRISLLCFVYLIGCFFFLWHGNEFFRKPIRRLMRQWNIFVTGNVIIILLKVILQVVGCVHLPALRLKSCWVIQLFGIACLKFGQLEPLTEPAGDRPAAKTTGGGGSSPNSVKDSSSICTANTDDAGLVWDAVVFVFLLIQKRIFSSWYFQWVVLEHKVQSALASRGAELINGQVHEQTTSQKKNEMKVMEKVRRKVERIRERQRRFKGTDPMPPPAELVVPSEVLGTPMDPNFEEHYQVSRSGDYYMFEDSDSDEEDINLAPSRPPEEEADNDEQPAGPDPLQMLNYAVMMSNIKNAVHEIKVINERNESERGSEITSPQMRNSTLFLNQRRNTMGSERSRITSIGPESAGMSGIPTVYLSPVHSLTCVTEVSDVHEGPSFETPPHFPRSVSDTEAMMITRALNEIPDAPPGTEVIYDKNAPTTFWEKFFNVIVFSQMFISTSIEVLNGRLNKISKDFRFVADKLRVEKKRLKNFYRQRVKEFFEREGRTAAGEGTTLTPLAEEEAIAGLEKAALRRPALRSQKSELHLELPDRDEEEFQSNHNVVMRLVIAAYFALMSRSELLCYFMIILLQMTTATVLSLPLPLMLFLWGSLSIPRPTRAFWIAVITYTMFIVMVKYVFHFPFIPENWPATGNPADPLYPPAILGVERINHYASFDLALLLVVFFHRSVLKSLGLWRSAREETLDELDTKTVHVDSSEGMTSLEKSTDMRSSEPNSSNDPEIRFAPNMNTTLTSASIEETTKEEVTFFTKYARKMKMFFANLTGNYTNRLNTNIYSYLFMCDFICFMIVVAFYWAFGPDAGGEDTIKDYFEENRVPTAFLLILIVQFCFMILERALYLRKNLQGKLIFQLFLIIAVHGFFFFYLPKETGRRFIKSVPVQLWYFVKCAYFLLSAYQIRSGYPTRILGNFLTNNYSYLNLYLFKGFIIIPFLMELRSLMDWIWTDTSMSMSEWLKLEDIYANIFVLKCWRMAEVRYPTPRATRYMTFWKYLIGGSILLLIILVIWFPLVLFSLTNAVGVPNEPLDCTVEVNLGGHQALYKVSARKEALVRYNSEMYDDMLYKFAKPNIDYTGVKNQEEVKQAQSFIHQYGRDDIWLVSLESDSSSLWSVSPPAETDIIKYLNSSMVNTEIKMFFRWTFSFAQRRGKMSQTVTGESSIALDRTTKTLLSEMLQRGDTGAELARAAVRVNNLYPFYVRVPSTGFSGQISVLQPRGQKNYRNVSVQLKRQYWPPNINSSAEVQWWSVRDPDANDTHGLSVLDSHSFITITAFIDKIFPQAWTVITGYGIVGLYISLVFVIGRLVRIWSSGQSYRIMFEDLPVVDRTLRLCLDIYLVRENREYRLEEDLYAKLIFLYRSPETMLKWTKLKRR